MKSFADTVALLVSIRPSAYSHTVLALAIAAAAMGHGYLHKQDAIRAATHYEATGYGRGGYDFHMGPAHHRGPRTVVVEVDYPLAGTWDDGSPPEDTTGVVWDVVTLRHGHLRVTDAP